MQHDWEELAHIALDVTRKAAAGVAQGYRKRPSASEKRRADLVTDYDLASEELIRRELALRAPGIAVVAEESGGNAAEEATFYCDPLDGTTNFVHGHPFWCVSIGVLSRGLPVAGAVVAPSLQCEWIGWQPGSALRNGEPCFVSDTLDLGSALLATGFPSDRSVAVQNNFATFERVKRNVRAVRRCGAAALDMCFVADGTYDGYWERTVNVWDIAGGAALVVAAGGRLTSLDGSPTLLLHGNVLATNGRIHEALVELIA
jgi:myo-inositol-1(or 4)-monophosphatase